MSNNKFSFKNILRGTLDLWWAIAGFVGIIGFKTGCFAKMNLMTLLHSWGLIQGILVGVFWVVVVIAVGGFAWYIYGPIKEYK